jgi:AraC-like DNA-binding protein
MFCAQFGEVDMATPEDRPFFAECEFLQFGQIGLTRFDVSLIHWARTKAQVSADARDDFLLGFNRSNVPLPGVQGGRESVVSQGGAIFYTNDEPGESWPDSKATIVGLCLPRVRIAELMAGAENMIGTVLEPTNTATRHLGRYIEFLLGCVTADEAVPDGVNVETLLLDLVALALGAGRDVAELARSRGLRAARIREILAAINANFSNPEFGTGALAVEIGRSPRYIQGLLHETGSSFSERLLELRLQKARAMLMAREKNRLKVSDVAFASGFSNVSYFNQAFRRRFGCSPTQYRGGTSA